MNKKVITTTASITVAALFASCTATQVRNFSTGIAGVAGVAALSGVGGGHRTTNALLAIAAVAATVAIISHYQATQEQRRYAEYRAAAIARSNSYATIKKEKKVRYVAVPVKKKSSTEKSGLMIYDTEKGQLASDNVYVPKASSSLKGNSIVEVDGKKALLESSFTGA
ncbi:MAG TPA: hypothetical protein VHM91_24885 [Verrucomicrobiales bacterium]|jgi:hypothetical protein|nr:hypothetical protein [Verrucomicrobiales bacterium]